MKFLTAHWQHLLFANYRVMPELLAPFVPRGTQLDLFEGAAFVSLVGFLFTRTRVMGVPIPYHISFEEVNLRFYVTPSHDPERRAVTFIKEIVPRAAIPLIANHLFYENYVALPMTHVTDDGHYAYSWDNGATNRMSGRVHRPLEFPVAGSLGGFITEHYWGYTQGHPGTLEYHVEHPPWKCCDLDEFEIEVDFARTYGQEFEFLSDLAPSSVQYAAGSEVSVSFPRRMIPSSRIQTEKARGASGVKGL